MKPKTIFVLSILVLFVFSLACQAGGSIAAIFATDTPTPTITPSPTPTFTPTITPTLPPTATSTFTPVPTGVVQQKLANGDTLFTDYDTRLSLVISTDWLVVPVSLQDVASLSNQLKESNPEIAEALSALKNLDPNTLRLLAFDSNSAHNDKGFATNLNITRIENVFMATLPMQMILDANAKQIKSSIPSSKILSTQVLTNEQGVEIGIMELEFPLKSPSGTITAYEKLALVQYDKGISMLTLATSESMSKTLLPIFNTIINSITIIDS